jgi:antitoxin VapB
MVYVYIQPPCKERDMTTTRLFKNGNSQAVRIPAELAYEVSDM